jgi:O-acetyl-ADP-ribose deacetylase (regulator of RNase III)
MLKFVQGNLLEAEVEALVNTVNTVGVMGKGIALQFKRAFPKNFDEYKKACDQNELEIGSVLTVDLGRLDLPRYIINFPTKQHWKGASKLEYVESGLIALAKEITRLKLKSIAVPSLGCGLGGLNWSDVKSRISSSLESLHGVEIVVFEPVGKPAAEQMKTATKLPAMTLGRATVLGLMGRYLSAMMDDVVTLLELHKLTYFMQEAGSDLRLSFVKGRYGPYAQNLHHVLEKIEGHYIVGYGDGSEEPGKEIQPKSDAVIKAESFMQKHSLERDRFTRVERLIEGFETPFAMELLGSVHWVAMNEPHSAKDVETAIQMIHAWNARKRESFTSEHIATAWARLDDQGWLKPA